MNAVILARVSSREQAEGMSIDAQTENLRHYCARKGLNIIKTFQLVESSTKAERKKFEEVLTFIKSQPNTVAIVADTIDRIQRGYKEYVELDELRNTGKIEIHFIRENLALQSKSNSAETARWGMGVFMAKTYVDQLRDNVKRSIDYNTQHGIWQSLAPIGYINSRDENNRPTIIIDPDRAFKVKRLFEEYATGMHTIGSLAAKAEEMGLRSRTHPTKPLAKSYIQRILNNPFYYGVMQVKGELYQHIYEPIITRELFDACQAVMNRKASKHVKYTHIPFAFNGLIRCADCGCAISSDMKTKKSGKTYTYLKCSHHRGNCTQRPVNEQVLFNQLQTEVFDNLTIPQSLINEIIKSLKTSVAAENEFITRSLNDLTAQMERAQQRLKRLLDLFLDSRITQTEHDNKRADIEREIFDIQTKQKAHVQADQTFVNTVESVLLVISHAGELFRSSKVEQKRALLNLLLSNCTLKNGILRFSLKKPFDIMVNANGSNLWSGRIRVYEHKLCAV